MGWNKGEAAFAKATEEMRKETIALLKRMAPLLAGQHPAVVAAVLARLTGVLLANVRPEDRLKFHTAFTKLVTQEVKELEGDD